MKAIQLHDKYSKEIVGTVLTQDYNVFTQEYNYDLVCERWDEYQKYNNSNTVNEPCIYDFVSREDNSQFCEVLDVDFYQPFRAK